MPFQVVKLSEKQWKLKKLKNGSFAKPTFLSKEAALNAGLNWMRWHHENPIVKGNKILSKKK